MTEATADSIERVAASPAIAHACAHIRATDAVTLADMRAAATIASPSFAERERAAWFTRRVRDAGACDVRCDDVGNVLALWPGASPDAAPIAVAAHLDTIFPAETVLDVRDEDNRILAPGIGDNARGLAVVLSLVRGLASQRVVLARPLVLAATVGEEGAGDLLGVKHLFATRSPLAGAAAFIAVDGAGSRRIVVRAVGSRRYRITFRGRGGHSWSDRGTPNPVDALGLAVARFGRIRLPASPAWGVTVARIGGGTSVNAIPASAWLELDVRAETTDVLGRLAQRVVTIVSEAADDASAGRRRGSAAITVTVETIGDRPAAAIPADAPLVRLARAATRAIGERPELVASSTDANVPMALGIPSIAIGGGGESGGTHTLGEWYSNERGPDGIVRALLVVAAAAGLA
jgi:acetylornithine deacetylase/succinyl-diaminopimelate desuccinylase-like protein